MYTISSQDQRDSRTLLSKPLAPLDSVETTTWSIRAKRGRMYNQAVGYFWKQVQRSALMVLNIRITSLVWLALFSLLIQGCDENPLTQFTIQPDHSEIHPQSTYRHFALHDLRKTKLSFDSQGRLTKAEIELERSNASLEFLAGYDKLTSLEVVFCPGILSEFDRATQDSKEAWIEQFCVDVRRIASLQEFQLTGPSSEVVESIRRQLIPLKQLSESDSPVPSVKRGTPEFGKAKALASELVSRMLSTQDSETKTQLMLELESLGEPATDPLFDAINNRAPDDLQRFLIVILGRLPCDKDNNTCCPIEIRELVLSEAIASEEFAKQALSSAVVAATEAKQIAITIGLRIEVPYIGRPAVEVIAGRTSVRPPKVEKVNLTPEIDEVKRQLVDAKLAEFSKHYADALPVFVGSRNLYARVYGLDSPEVQQFYQRLEMAYASFGDRIEAVISME